MREPAGNARKSRKQRLADVVVSGALTKPLPAPARACRKLHRGGFQMGLQIGSIAPDFKQDSTEGTIKFHDWIGD